MSLDFPERKKWLAMRAAAPLLNTLVHDSSRGTYCVGANINKRRLGRGRQRVKMRKRLQRALRAARAAGAREVKPHRSGGQR